MAAPVAMGTEPPTMALAPRWPVEKSAMCMPPPRPAAVALVLAEQLGDGAVDVLLAAPRPAGPRGREALLARHARLQLLVVHLADGAEALGDGVAVAAVASW